MENADEISQIVASLPNMDRSRLVAQWKKQFSSPPHPKLRIELMRPVLAYRIQENAAGLNTRGTRWRLPDHSQGCQTSRFKAGTRILAILIGLLPMALKLGEGSEAYAPLAQALIGGLAVSVALTIFLVPAGFLLAYRNAPAEPAV